jgi:hypothetical protein
VAVPPVLLIQTKRDDPVQKTFITFKRCWELLVKASSLKAVPTSKQMLLVISGI